MKKIKYLLALSGLFLSLNAGAQTTNIYVFTTNALSNMMRLLFDPTNFNTNHAVPYPFIGNISNTNGIFLVTNDTRLLTLTNTNNAFSASNILADSVNHSGRGRFKWDANAFGVGGSLISPDSAAFNWFLNTGHGGIGDGSEMQMQANLFYIGPADGGHIQIGLGSDVRDLMFMQGGVIPTNGMGYTHLFGYHNAWSNGSGGLGFGAFVTEFTNYNRTTGDSRLKFWYSPVGTGTYPSDTSLVGYTNLVSYDTAGYVEFHQATKAGITEGTSTGTYDISFQNKNWQNVGLTTNTVFTLSHFTVTNEVQTVDVFIYPGLGNWGLTFPTNILWESPSGLSPAPTNIIGSTVLHVTLTAAYGSTTNIFGRYLIAPYTPVVDADAAAFIAAAGITNNTEKYAANYFVTNLKLNNVWTGWDALYLYLGSASGPSSYNIRNTANFQITFHGSPVYNSQGITGDAATAYGDTGFNPSTASSPNYVQNSASLVVYTHTASPTAAAIFAGVTGGNTFRANVRNSGASQAAPGGLNNATQDENPVAFTGDFNRRVVFVNRTASTVQTISVDNTTGASASTATAGVPNNNIFVLATDDAGSLFKPSNVTLGFTGIGKGWNSTDQNNIITIVQNTMAILGR